MGYVVSGWETAEDIKEAGGVEGIEGAIDPAPCADAMVNPVMLTSAALGNFKTCPGIATA